MAPNEVITKKILPLNLSKASKILLPSMLISAHGPMERIHGILPKTKMVPKVIFMAISYFNLNFSYRTVMIT